MRKISVLFTFLLCVQSCQEVVDVDLATEDPRLVIEATGIQKKHDSTGEFRVKLSKTAPYFQDSIPKVSGAAISLEINDHTIAIPESDEQKGVYQQQVPMIYEVDYKLVIKSEEEEYQGKTRLYSTPVIDGVQQEKGLFDSDKTQLKVFYTDPKEKVNYYLFSYISKHGKNLSISDDQYYNGNQISTLYTEEFIPGDSINIRINGTGKDFNRYISILLEQSGPADNPFTTAPATVRGNMVNTGNAEKFPLGYFRLSQEFETTFIVN